MRVLGLYDDHNCGATVVEDGKILAAIEEERLSRIKLHNGTGEDGPPWRSLEAVLNITNSSVSNIDRIAIAIQPPNALMKYVLKDLVLQKNFKWFISSFVTRSPRWDNYWFLYPLFYNWWRIVRVKRLLKRYGLEKTPIDFVDHHTAHAASAYYVRGLEKAMVFTLDGQGDGLCGGVYLGKDTQLKSLDVASSYNSPGLFYNLITWMLGFKPNRHEGKITGLAAHGDYEKVKHIFDDLFSINGKGEFSYNLAKRTLWHHPYPHRTNYPRFVEQFKSQINGYSREDIAAGVQVHSERVVAHWIAHYLKGMENVDLCLAGGVFANVRINQKIAELDNVRSVFIFPAMGDGGLSTGAALYSYFNENSPAALDRKVVPLKDVYLGPGYSNEEIVAELKKANVEYKHYDKVEPEIARILAAGHVVARFNGRMEFGPRALGNRSILYQPTDPTVNDWLNEKLHRTEFMPFAPVTLKEHTDASYHSVGNNDMPAMYMTITFDCSSKMKEKCPAVVHVDGTARPQLVTDESNKSYYSILKEYQKLTGLSSIINTSFNMHEEPIVCSPGDAIRAFQLGHLEYLAIGDFIVKNEDAVKEHSA
ncbi:MAG: carbamoyltransferase [bacterium]